MNWQNIDWQIVSILVTAGATIFIAISSIMSYLLSRKICSKEAYYRKTLETMTKQHHQDLSDLYQAIVIATLISGSSRPAAQQSICDFKEMYSGKVEIFNKGTI